MPWYLYLALKQLFSTFQRIFFTALSVVSVGLGVMIMIVVLGVMGGFSTKIGEETQETTGDVQLSAEQLIRDPAQLQAVLSKIPGVVATTPYARGFVLVIRDNLPAPAEIRGLDLDTIDKVTPLAKYIPVGSLDELDDDSVILSSQLATSLGASIGSMVQIFSPLMFQQSTSADERLLPKELKVVGIFEIGHQQLDKATVFVTLRQMQELYGLGSAVHAINIKIDPELEADQETRLINQTVTADQRIGTLPRDTQLWARSWKQQNSDLLWAVQLEKSMMTLILLVVIVAGAFLTMGLLIVLVLKKTREIGLLVALGSSRLQIGLCFCLQGVGIGIMGSIGGLITGFTILHYRTELINLVTHFTGSQEAVENVYQFAQIPAHVTAGDVRVIVISAIFLSTLAGAIPAFIAARMKPVEALRNE